MVNSIDPNASGQLLMMVAQQGSAIQNFVRAGPTTACAAGRCLPSCIGGMGPGRGRGSLMRGGHARAMMPATQAACHAVVPGWTCPVQSMGVT